MSRADVSDSAIASGITDVKNNLNHWLLLGYVPKSDTKLKVAASGTGGFSELSENFDDGKSLFALISMEVNKTRKLVYISWCGEGVSGMKKGLFNNHSGDVSALFKGFHVQINARNEGDLKQNAITDRLKKATGASYDSGGKIQGSQDLVPTSVSQAKTQATQSNANFKQADKTDYNKKNDSDSYWKEQRADEEKMKQAPVKKTNMNDYSKTNERQAFWKQQQEAPAPASRPVAPASTGSLKGRFESQVAQQQTQQTKPAPTKGFSAPPPPPSKGFSAPPPPPAPVVEEEQQQDNSYQEQQQDNSYQEQQQDNSYQEQQQDTSNQEQPAAQEENWDNNNQNQGGESGNQEYWGEDNNQQNQGYEETPASSGANEGGSSSGGNQCRALYDYTGENETDLSFKEGDIITVLEDTDPSGWWNGEVNGVSGYFPSNFVERI